LKRLIGFYEKWETNPIDKITFLSLANKSQNKLESHRMHESYAEAIIPLKDQPELRNTYDSFLKYVRFGRLLEDLDTMAGNFLLNPI
jgi:acyl-coenzyme A thioesterase 9